MGISYTSSPSYLAPTSTETGNDTTTTSGTWRQLIASTTNAVKWIEIEGNSAGTAASAGSVIAVGIGAGGSEVIIGQTRLTYAASSLDDTHIAVIHIAFPYEVAAGTRIAWRPTFGGVTVSCDIGYTIGERA